MEPIIDTAQCFCFNINQLLRLDEEFKKKWRYKHKQAPLKEPIRQTLKNAKAWAAKMAELLEVNTNPDMFERYAGKLWLSWETFIQAREDYLFGDRTPLKLAALKAAENELKTHTRAMNHLISTHDEK